MKWMDNIKQIINSGTVGDCPYCGSGDTDYVYIKHKNGYAALEVACKSCGEYIHARCKEVPPNRKQITMEEALKEERERNQKRSLAV